MVQLLALLFAFLCACTPEPERSDRQSASPEIVARYLSASERLQSDFLDRGWVVSRDGGLPANVGDSLLWSGLALSALPCDQGDAIEANLIDMVTRHDGGLVRYEPLANPVSLDGAIGLWHGIAHRITCAGKAELWREPVRLHAEFLERSKGYLSNEAKDAQAPIFLYVPDLLHARLNGAANPSSDLLGVLRPALALWAKAVVDNRASCYRVHLGLLMMETLAALGKDGNRANFCVAAKGAGMPLVDHFCGQPEPLLTFIEDFEFNQWEFALQRCAGWESPDSHGYETPGLDLIVAIKHAYQL